MKHNPIHNSNQFSSVQSLSCVWLFATPCSTPGLPVHHQLPEFTQTHVHWVSDAIQLLILCCPLLLPPSIFPRMSQLFASGGQILEFQLQHQSFQWTLRTNLLQNGLLGSPCSPRDSQESSPTPQFKSINSSALSFLYIPTLTSIHDYWKNHSLD